MADHAHRLHLFGKLYYHSAWIDEYFFVLTFISNSLAERGVIITSASKIESDGYHKLLDFTKQALSKDVGRAHKNYSTGFLITGCLVPLHHYKQELF
jgi:hypothetical protein